LALLLCLLGLSGMVLGGCAAGYAAEDGSLRDPPFDDDDWGDDDAGDDDTSGDDDGCEIVGTFPVDGDPTVYYRDIVEVFFAEPVSAASVVLHDDAGSVPGQNELSVDGMSASFDPFGADPGQFLEPMTTYYAAVDAPGCHADWSCTTGELALDLADNVVFEDALYAIYLEQATLSAPKGGAALLAPVGIESFLLAVDQVSKDELTLRAGGMELDTYNQPIQDLCQVTLDLTPGTPATLTGAHLSLPPTDLTLTLEPGIYLDLLGVGVEIEFTPDGAELDEGRLEGYVDGFAFDEALEALNSKYTGGTCETLDQLGTPCEACPGSPEQLTCIHFVWEEIRGELVGMHQGLTDIDEGDLEECGK